MSLLAKAIVAAQRTVKSVKKDAYNAGVKYAYTSSEEVFGEGRRALNEVGLAASLSGSELIERESAGSSTLTLRCTFLLVHEAGESREGKADVPIVGVTGGRPLDRCVMSARTTALAYYLRDLLCMQRGDYDDLDASRGDEDKAADPMAEIAACKTIHELATLAIAFASKEGDPPAMVIATFDARAKAIYGAFTDGEKLRVSMVPPPPVTVDPWRKILIDGYQTRAGELRGGAK